MLDLTNAEIRALKKAELGAASIAEQTRLRSVRLYALGYDAASVAMILQCPPGSVNEWVTKYREAGVEGLLDRQQEKKPRYDYAPHPVLGEGLYVLYCDNMPVASVYQKSLAVLIVQLLNA